MHSHIRRATVTA